MHVITGEVWEVFLWPHGVIWVQKHAPLLHTSPGHWPVKLLLPGERATYLHRLSLTPFDQVLPSLTTLNSPPTSSTPSTNLWIYLLMTLPPLLSYKIPAGKNHVWFYLVGQAHRPGLNAWLIFSKYLLGWCCWLWKLSIFLGTIYKENFFKIPREWENAIQNYNWPLRYSMCTKNNFVLICKPFTYISFIAPHSNLKS